MEDAAILWIVGVFVAFFVVRSIWRTYTDRSHALGRQAANMNWVAVGRVADQDGYKDLELRRAGLEASISFQYKHVQLLKPYRAKPFSDFVELERWLARGESAPKNEDEGAGYLEEISKFIKSHGMYEALWEHHLADPAYHEATLRMHRAGFESDQAAKVVAALTLDSLMKYQRSPELAILFLEELEHSYFESGDRIRVSARSEPNLHDGSDRGVEIAKTTLSASGARPDEIYLLSELAVFAATSLVRHESGTEIHQMSWNTYKRAVENRILAVQDDNSERSRAERRPDGSVVFAHYTSSYWSKMDEIDELIESLPLNARDTARARVVGRFSQLTEISAAEAGELFEKLEEISAAQILPDIVKSLS